MDNMDDFTADLENLRDTISELHQNLALERHLHDATRAAVLYDAKIIASALVRIMLATESKLNGRSGELSTLRDEPGVADVLDQHDRATGILDRDDVRARSQHVRPPGDLAGRAPTVAR